MSGHRERQYHDAGGRPVSLDTLCRKEPAWAANRIRAMREALRVAQWGAFRHTPTGLCSGGRDSRSCPACMGICPEDTHPDWSTYGHRPECPIRIALGDDEDGLEGES